MKLKTLLIPIAAIVGLSFTANAGSIGVNVGPSDVSNELGATDVAGVVPQDDWNNLLGGNVAATAVTDDAGTLLATTVQVQTQWSYNTNTVGTGANNTLMNSALDNNGGEMGFVVTGIPYATYDVIIYHEGASNASRGGPFFIRDTDGGNAIIATQNSYDVTNFDGTFVDASTVGSPVVGSGIDDNGTPGDPNDDFAVNSNYVRFNNLTLANIGIRSDAANPLGIATDRAPLTGFQIVEAAADVAAPTPDPMTFASVPAAAGDSQITMTATTATDPSGVEYYFTETSGNPGGADSGWQDSETYVDTGLDPGTTYTYNVKARDKSAGQNEGAASGDESATTDSPDVTAPTPDPMTFAVVPAADSDTEISMTASTATDLNGVEYYFTETSGNPGGDDSGWQDSTSYTDSGLDPSTTYSYTVKARDKSAGQNETAESAGESATTNALPTLGTMIGVNVGPTGASNEIGTIDVAGVVAQNNWNDLLGGNVGATAVNDDGGTLLATTVQVQTQWSYNTGAGGSGANQTLMNSALDNNGGEMGFVVTGIPYAVYDVIIYHEGGSNDGRGGPFFIRDTDGGNAIIATQNSYDATNFDGTFVDASTVGTIPGSGIDDNGTPGDPNDDFAVNSNYVRFNNLTLANIGIRSDAANPLGLATDRAPISGMQIIEAGGVVLDPYDTWSGGFGGLSDPTYTVDFDGGGLQTGIEWVTGGDPTDPTDDAGLAPTLDTTTTPGSGLFVFRRTDDAAGDTNTTINVEYGSDLQGWTNAQDGVDGVVISVDDDFYGVGIDKVTASLPDSLAVGGELYARLNVVVTP